MQSSQTIWIVRHGTRIDMIEPAWKQTAARPLDPHLAPCGIDEARRLAERLAGQRIDAVYASPFLRALQTAAPIATTLGVPLRVEPGMGEWLNGEWFDQVPTLFPSAAVDWHCEQLDRDYRSPATIRCPETWADMLQRTAQTIRRLSESGQSFVAVGHGASVVGMIAALRGVEAEYDAPAPPVAGVSRFVRTGQAWRMNLFADTAHLDGGAAGRAWARLTRSRGTALLPPEESAT